MSAIGNLARLGRAGTVLAISGARVLPDDVNLPPPLVLFGRITAPLRQKSNGVDSDTANEAKLSAALTSLGPSYIKLGQFLATRDDIIGRKLAADLSTLQDRLPPFSQDEARAAVEEALEAPIDKLFASFGPPVAAASIAQVHKAQVRLPDGSLKACRGQSLASRHRAALPPGSGQLSIRRENDRALPCAVAPVAPHRHRRHARQIRRHRDGPSHGSRRHLRDGRQHQD